MTANIHKRNRQARLRILAALGAASLALIVASPANAIYRSYEPGDGEEPVIQRTLNTDDTSGKKGCTIDIKGPDGKVQSSITYAHGYSFSTVNKATGKTHTFTCNNGTWEETVSSTIPTGGLVYEAAAAWVDGSVVTVDLHAEYTYSSDGVYYAAP